jgi:hypothetical protein
MMVNLISLFIYIERYYKMFKAVGLSRQSKPWFDILLSALFLNMLPGILNLVNVFRDSDDEPPPKK